MKKDLKKPIVDAAQKEKYDKVNKRKQQAVIHYVIALLLVALCSYFYIARVLGYNGFTPSEAPIALVGFTIFVSLALGFFFIYFFCYKVGIIATLIFVFLIPLLLVNGDYNDFKDAYYTERYAEITNYEDYIEIGQESYKDFQEIDDDDFNGLLLLDRSGTTVIKDDYSFEYIDSKLYYSEGFVYTIQEDVVGTFTLHKYDIDDLASSIDSTDLSSEFEIVFINEDLGMMLDEDSGELSSFDSSLNVTLETTLTDPDFISLVVFSGKTVIGYVSTVEIYNSDFSLEQTLTFDTEDDRAEIYLHIFDEKLSVCFKERRGTEYLFRYYDENFDLDNEVSLTLNDDFDAFYGYSQYEEDVIYLRFENYGYIVYIDEDFDLSKFSPTDFDTYSDGETNFQISGKYFFYRGEALDTLINLDSYIDIKPTSIFTYVGDNFVPLLVTMVIYLGAMFGMAVYVRKFVVVDPK